MNIKSWRVVRLIAIVVVTVFSPATVIVGYLLEASLLDAGVPYAMIPNYMVGSLYGMAFGIFLGSWILEISEDMEERERRMMEMTAPITFL